MTIKELVRNKQICRVLLESEQLWSICEIVLVDKMPWIQLPSSVKKMVIKCLVLCCANSTNDQIKLQFNASVLEPLSIRLDALTSSTSSSLNKLDGDNNSIHSESTIRKVMSLMETLNGIIEGASPSFINFLLPFVLSRIKQGVHLLDIYHNYGEIVELVLCMFNGVIENVLPHLIDWPQATAQIYQCFLQLIQVFSKQNSGMNLYY